MAIINKFVYAETEAGLNAASTQWDNNSIIFIKDKGVIKTHGQEFGIPASKLASIESDLAGLKGVHCFNAISDGGSTKFEAKEGSQTIVFTGDNKTISVEVSADGVKIKGVEVTAQGDNYVTASAAGNKVTVTANVTKMANATANSLADAKDVKDYIDTKVSAATDDRVDTIIDAVGLDDDGSYQTQTGTTYLGSATSIAEETKALDGELKKVADALAAEIAKFTGSKTIKGGTTYETDIKIALVAAADSTPAKIALQDNTGAELSSVSLADILGKHVVKSSSYSDATGKLTLVFETAGGTDQSVDIDLGKLLDINDVVIASDSSDYLEAEVKTVSSDEGQLELSVKIGDVSEGETGLADASDVKDYVDGEIEEAIGNLDKTESTVTAGKNISFKYKEEDGIVTISDLTENYATVTKATTGITVTGGTGLVTGTDLKNVVDYVDEKLGDTSAIDELDATETSDDGEYIEVTVTQEDGLITGVSVSETYVTVSNGAITGKGLIKGEDVKSVIESLDSTSTVSDSKNLVTVKTEIADGKLKAGDGTSVSVTYGTYNGTNGIATTSDTKTYVDGMFSWVEIN